MPGYFGKKEGLGNILGKKSTGKRLTRMGRKMSSAPRRGNAGGAPTGAGVPDQIANMQARSSVPRIRAMLDRARR